jgi:hypothetical protein
MTTKVPSNNGGKNPVPRADRDVTAAHDEHLPQIAFPLNVIWRNEGGEDSQGQIEHREGRFFMSLNTQVPSVSAAGSRQAAPRTFSLTVPGLDVPACAIGVPSTLSTTLEVLVDRLIVGSSSPVLEAACVIPEIELSNVVMDYRSEDGAQRDPRISIRLPALTGAVPMALQYAQERVTFVAERMRPLVEFERHVDALRRLLVFSTLRPVETRHIDAELPDGS